MVNVTGPISTQLTWKSSCGGDKLPITIIDGNNEYVNFSCSSTTGDKTISPAEEKNPRPTPVPSPTPVPPGISCSAPQVYWQAPLGNPNGTGEFEKLGLNISAHPEIAAYRIQWFYGGWSPWYKPGVSDIDSKLNLDGTQRRLWAYFDDHNHEFVQCGANTTQPLISSVNPQPIQVGSTLTVSFTNGGQTGSVILKTLDGTKSWYIPYTTGAVLNGFVYYDGSKVSFTVPSMIGRGQLPENTGYETPIPITSGTYNLTVYATGCPAVSGTCLGTSAISKVFPITISAPSATQPSITVLSPNGGETYKIGDTLNIKWNASNFSDSSKVYIELRPDGPAISVGSQAVKIVAISPTSGYYLWQVPNTIIPGQYIIEVYKADQNGIVNSNESVKDVSDTRFTISSVTSTQPSITVLSPNGGETLTAGQHYTITWSLQGKQTGTAVTINAESQSTGNTFYIATVSSGSSYDWVVGDYRSTSITSGDKYKIWVFGALYGSGATGSDKSDNPFTISSATSTQPSITLISPFQGYQGQTVPLVITGRRFTGANNISGTGLNPVLDRGFQLNTSQLISDSQINATYAIASDAVVGTRTITVTTSYGTSNGATFTVLSVATSSPSIYALSVSKSGTGAGTVTSNPAGINCGSTCTANYSQGTNITLSASPASASVFTGWTGCDSVSWTQQCSILMNGNKSITATFNRITTTTSTGELAPSSAFLASIQAQLDSMRNQLSDLLRMLR